MIILTLARKPLSEGSVAANVLKHGNGGINIDRCRIAYPDGKPESGWSKRGAKDNPGFHHSSTFRIREIPAKEIQERVGKGRWPSNLILNHLPSCVCLGSKQVQSSNGKRGAKRHLAFGLGGAGETVGYANPEGEEKVLNWDCQPGCPVRGLDQQSGVCLGMSGGGATSKDKNPGWVIQPFNRQLVRLEWVRGDTGGASRFFKQVKSK